MSYCFCDEAFQPNLIVVGGHDMPGRLRQLADAIDARHIEVTGATGGFHKQRPENTLLQIHLRLPASKPPQKCIPVLKHLPVIIEPNDAGLSVNCHRLSKKEEDL